MHRHCPVSMLMKIPASGHFNQKNCSTLSLYEFETLKMLQQSLLNHNVNQAKYKIQIKLFNQYT